MKQSPPSMSRALQFVSVYVFGCLCGAGAAWLITHASSFAITPTGKRDAGTFLGSPYAQPGSTPAPSGEAAFVLDASTPDAHVALDGGAPDAITLPAAEEPEDDHDDTVLKEEPSDDEPLTPSKTQRLKNEAGQMESPPEPVHLATYNLTSDWPDNRVVGLIRGWSYPMCRADESEEEGQDSIGYCNDRDLKTDPPSFFLVSKLQDKRVEVSNHWLRRQAIPAVTTLQLVYGKEKKVVPLPFLDAVILWHDVRTGLIMLENIDTCREIQCNQTRFESQSENEPVMSDRKVVLLQVKPGATTVGTSSLFRRACCQ